MAGAAQANVRSSLNGYDALDRLTGTQVGQLDAAATGIVNGTLKQSDAWSLDLLGNWVGVAGVAAGRMTVTTGGAAAGTKAVSHSIDERNRITNVTTTNPGGSGTAVATKYDAAGNLVFDGSYYYQYDAWNRLIQVNQGSWDAGGVTYSVGALLKNYAYDGLGRLARSLSPYPAPPPPGGGTSTLNRTEKFYYDGIRRVQELIADPVASVNFADMSGDPVLQSVAEGNSEGNEDGAGTPMSMEAELTEGVATITAPPAPWLEREYVWGPGGGNGGIDELLVQYDAQRKPWWVVQDEGGDVVALCDLGAAGADGRVVAQFTHDAYGSPLSYDNLANHPLMHCGHKGLFVDRLDVGVASAGGNDTVRITPGAVLLCHNRNRTYSPGIGRFLQADPNATAMALLQRCAHHGKELGAVQAIFDLEDHYGNGTNSYQYLGSSPWQRSDALGLEWEDYYDNVILPIVDFVDGVLPVSVVSPLNALLDGYRQLMFMVNLVHNAVQEPAFDAEEHLDWALDWASEDDDNPRFGARIPDMDLGPSSLGLDIPMARVRPSNYQVNMGREAEELARTKEDAVKCRHMVNIGVGKNGKMRRRLYDGEKRPVPSRRYMEAKWGTGQMNWRMKKQALLDARLIRQTEGETQVKWLFYPSKNAAPKGKTELEMFLQSLGIECERM